MLIWLKGNILLPLKLQSSWFNWKILQEYFSYICILVTFRNALWQLKMAIYSWHMSLLRCRVCFSLSGNLGWSMTALIKSILEVMPCHCWEQPLERLAVLSWFHGAPSCILESPALYKFTLQLQKPCVEALGPHGRKVWSYCARLSRHTCQDDRE